MCFAEMPKRSSSSRGIRGASASYTLDGPPERMIPAGAKPRTNSVPTLKGWISL